MTAEEKEILNEYMQVTGQTFQELMGGSQAFGWDFIVDLMKKALEKNKKIVWFYKSDTDLNNDVLSYRLD